MYQMKFFFLIFILLHTVSSQSDLMFNPFSNEDMKVQELDVQEPYLWQMAAFVARQMSTKKLKFKLMTLTSAQKSDSTYSLKMILKRIKNNEPMEKDDVIYCTVEVNDSDQIWEMDNFGCLLPAVVRTRDSAKNTDSSKSNFFHSKTIPEYREPLNTIPDDLVSIKPKKTLPFLYHQQIIKHPALGYAYRQYPPYYRN